MLRLTSPSYRCKFGHQKNKRITVSSKTSIDENITSSSKNSKDGSLKRCKFKNSKDGSLKRCKFAHHENTNTSSSSSENSKDGPLKRCKFVHDENTNTSSNKSKDNPTLEGPLKRCKFASNKNTTCINIGGNGGGGGGGRNDGPMDLSLISPSPLKRCKFVHVDSDSDLEPEGFRRPWKGQTLDVILFLSNYGETNYLIRSNGQKVALDIVLGKHLVICCVSLPMLDGEYYFDSMVTAYSELSRDDFEMVLVAHVKPGFDKGEALFNDFFSPLPCLAIPFSESHTRGNICTFIGFRLGSLSCPDATAILVDPTQTILHYHLTIYHFHAFGSDWFPFLQSTVESIETQDEVLRCRLDPKNPYRVFKITSDAFMKDPLIRERLSLHDILLCDPSLVLPRIGAGSAATVSELSNKYVGLYLCQSDMELMSSLKTALKLCLIKEQELVIIVVCVPLHETIEEMQKDIKCCFEKCNVATFFHPNNSKVWRRLWRIFGQKSVYDEMVILPPNCQSGELYGKIVVESLGEKGYPFVRSTLLERTFTALRSLTPVSLFKGTTKKRTCLIRNGEESTVRESVIKGKRLLLYLDWLETLADRYQTDNGKLCCLLMEHYCKIQAMGWEVVFVPLDIQDKDEYHGMLAKMPWPITPFCDAVETLKLFFPCMPPSSKLIAFEADGRMVSTEINERLKKCEFNDSLFYDNLYEEISDDLYTLKSDM